MRGRAGRGAAIALITLLGSTAARAQTDPWWSRDKALHFGVSATIAAGAYGLSAPLLEPRWQRALVGASVGLGFGIGKELYDLSGHGHPSWKDLTWDAAGVAVGVGFALGLDYLISALVGGGDPAPSGAPGP